MNLLPIVLLLALQADNPEFLQHEQAGIAAQKASNLTVAADEFRKATELDPQSGAAFFNLGAVYMQSHHFTEAIEPLTRALELNENLPGIHELLGYALLSQGNTAAAIPQFQAANSQQGLGVAQLESGDLADAVSNLEAALAKQPDDPDLLYYLARAAGLLSQQLNDRLMSAYPGSARAYESLAESYAALHQVPQAEDAYRKAIAQRPDLPGIHLALGEVYAGSSQWSKAEGEFREECKLRPASGEAAYRLGSALLENGKIKEARRQLALADRLQPDMPETLYSLGKAASLDGDNATAIVQWKRVVALEPSGSLAAKTHFAMAGAYRQLGTPAAASEQMSLYQKLKPQTPGATDK